MLALIVCVDLVLKKILKCVRWFQTFRVIVSMPADTLTTLKLAHNLRSHKVLAGSNQNGILLLNVFPYFMRCTITHETSMSWVITLPMKWNTQRFMGVVHGENTPENWALKDGMISLDVVYHQLVKPASKEKVHEPRHHAVVTAMRQALGVREAG